MKSVSILFLTILLALTLSMGCGGDQNQQGDGEQQGEGDQQGDGEQQVGGAPEAIPPQDIPEIAAKAAEIAKLVEGAPSGLNEVLQSKGMSLEDFEKLLFEIAEDPELSKAYAAARQ